MVEELNLLIEKERLNNINLKIISSFLSAYTEVKKNETFPAYSKYEVRLFYVKDKKKYLLLKVEHNSNKKIDQVNKELDKMFFNEITIFLNIIYGGKTILEKIINDDMMEFI